jgi:sugar/nucleoside kinase (ribokinase family)
MNLIWLLLNLPASTTVNLNSGSRCTINFLVTTFLNAAPYRDGITLDDELFKMVDILCANEGETESLVGRQLKSIGDFEKAAAEFLDSGPTFAIVTLGANGAVVAAKLEDGSVIVDKVDALQVNAIDTTVGY